MENSRPSSYYECTFCKRGFTNAQALGGHMNIHRKGKSKLIKPQSPNPNPNFQFPTLNSAAPPRALYDYQTHMNMYLTATHVPPPPPPPMSCATCGPGGSGLYHSHMCYYSTLTTQFPCNPNCPPGQLGFHGGHPGFNLEMQIGSSRTHGYDDREGEMEEVQDGEDTDGDDDGVLDLELRLGRPPRRR